MADPDNAARRATEALKRAIALLDQDTEHIEEMWVAKPGKAAAYAWIDANRAEARKLGLFAPEGQWNELPPMRHAAF